MKMFHVIALKVCPVLALIFSIIVTATTIYIEEGISTIFIFLCVQVYLNWYCIYSISRNTTTMKSTERDGNSIAIPMNDANNTRINDEFTARSLRQHQGRRKYWYCDKCCYYTYGPTQHCGPCKKCFHYRDHHCFFIGGCVLRQNMGNFILICFYTSLACLYSLVTIGPRLYENLTLRVVPSDIEKLPNFLNFCFPIALARLLITGEDTDIMLVTLFDTLFSVFFMCLVYGAWKLYLCVAGKQKYHPHVPTRQNFKEIFGNYGVTNFVFPYNGLLGTRDIDGKYELKEV